MKTLRSPLTLLLVLAGFAFSTITRDVMAAEPDQGRLAFTATDKREFNFDTGLLRGKLLAPTQARGLSQVAHVPSGKRLDRSLGLFSLYRVFTRGHRYGTSAWDWPAQAMLNPDGSVTVNWPAADRPFELQAHYRWIAPGILDLEITVKPKAELPDFEVFLGSYFEAGFNQASVYARNPEPVFLRAGREAGDWQMFPRDPAAIKVAQDGRWKLEPNPVNWVMRPQLAEPLAIRRAESLGLMAALMAPRTDCFALAMPHEAEGHYSVYLSLFGRTIPAGETARARARLVLGSATPGAAILEQYKSYTSTSR